MAATEATEATEATKQPRYKRSPAITATLLDDEIICMNLDTGLYVGLKNVGQVVWDQLEVPCTFADLLHVVMNEYDVDEHQARADLEAFMAEMLEAGLVQLS